MQMSSPNKTIMDIPDRFAILPELMKRVVSKMDGKAQVRMAKTCKSMSSTVEHSWKTYNYKDMTIAHVHKMLLRGCASFLVAVLPTYNEDARTKGDRSPWGQYQELQIQVKRTTGTVTYNLPISLLDSSIWRFVQFDKLDLHGDLEGYLSNMRALEHSSEYLTARGSSSTIAAAMKVFKPTRSTIYPFYGDLNEILAALPFESWKQKRKGNVLFLEKNVLKMREIPRNLGDFTVEEIGRNQFDDRNFELTTPNGEKCGFTIILELYDRIEYLEV